MVIMDWCVLKMSEKYKPVDNPKTNVISKNKAILSFEYSFAGEKLHIELMMHRELLYQVLERMDNYHE